MLSYTNLPSADAPLENVYAAYYAEQESGFYAGMAAACREQFIRDHTLSTRSVEVTEHLPIAVNVIGAAAHNKFLASDKKLTKFSEAIDILGRIKAKGINNVYLRYSGALEGGINEKNVHLLVGKNKKIDIFSKIYYN